MTQPTPVAVVPQPVAEKPAGPDPDTVILSIAQLRQAVLDASGLEQEDIDSMPATTKLDYQGIKFEIGKHFPGTEGSAPAEQLYVFDMFFGDQYDDVGDHMAGDVRIYVIPAVATSPTAKDWRLFTFSRIHPSMRLERMNQSVFIDEVGGEWSAKDEEYNGGGDDDGDPAAGAAPAEGQAAS